jgi:hypothetical protein
VVDNDGTHAPQEESGTASLSEGWHKIVVEYFEQSGGEALTVSWSGPNFNQTEFAPSRLFLSPSQADSQRIGLSAGWNLISSRLAPSDSAMTAIFDAVATDLAVVQNQQGDTYDPDAGSNSLTTWDDRQGYRVYMNASQTLTLEGTTLDTPTLDLNAGWNLIPFYPTSEMSVQDAFSSISDKVEIVKDEAGNSYVPSLGIDEIGMLQPGRAYKVYLTSSTSFSYP